MPDKSNDTGSRIKSRTRGDYVRRVPAERQFGTPEEIQNRIGGTFGTLPDNTPSSFTQIGPGAGGARPDALSPQRRSGNQKFGDGRRYV